MTPLPPPAVLAADPDAPLFDRLPTGQRGILVQFFASMTVWLLAKLATLSIEGESVRIGLRKFLYAALCVAAEMWVIGDNIAAFWSPAVSDLQFLGTGFTNTRYFTVIPHHETLYQELGIIPISFSKPLNYPTSFIIFTVFPGCGHFGDRVCDKVISACRVICRESQ